MLFEKLNSDASIEAIQDVAFEITNYIYKTSILPDVTLATYWCAKQAIVKGFGLCKNKKTKTKKN
jgi:hypothetical protein